MDQQKRRKHCSSLSSFLVLLLLLCFLPVRVFSSDCTTPIPISIGDTYYHTNFAAEFIYTIPSCGGVEAHDGIGVWYRFTGTGEGVILDTCSVFTEIDTQIIVFEGNSCFSAACVTGNDDLCTSGLGSAVAFFGFRNVQYIIFVASFPGTSLGSYFLTLSRASGGDSGDDSGGGSGGGSGGDSGGGSGGGSGGSSGGGGGTNPSSTPDSESDMTAVYVAVPVVLIVMVGVVVGYHIYKREQRMSDQQQENMGGGSAGYTHGHHATAITLAEEEENAVIPAGKVEMVTVVGTIPPSAPPSKQP